MFGYIFYIQHLKNKVFFSQSENKGFPYVYP